jgi:hypothetical protein
VLHVFPAGTTLLQSAKRSLGERWNGRFGPTPRLDRVATISGEPTIFMGFYSRLSQGDEAQSTKANITAYSLYHCPQHPTLRARGVDDEVQSIAVTVSAGDGEAIDPN